MENYYLNDVEVMDYDKKVHILLIYDIVENKRRSRFVKFINGFGIRVQKSAFEGIITPSLYKKILNEIPRFIDETEDSVRVYKLLQISEKNFYGQNTSVEDEDLIIL